jgi:hypothetical protein
MIIGNDPGEGYCSSCFGTEYPTKLPTGKRDRFEKKLDGSDEPDNTEDNYELFIRD